MIMRLTITHLKAPWPEGSKVGDVVDLPFVPGWAQGKCVAAPEATPALLDTDAEAAAKVAAEAEAKAAAEFAEAEAKAKADAEAAAKSGKHKKA